MDWDNRQLTLFTKFDKKVVVDFNTKLEEHLRIPDSAPRLFGALPVVVSIPGMEALELLEESGALEGQDCQGRRIAGVPLPRPSPLLHKPLHHGRGGYAHGRFFGRALRRRRFDR